MNNPTPDYVTGLRKAAAWLRDFDVDQSHWQPANRMDRATVSALARGLDAMADSAERRIVAPPTSPQAHAQTVEGR